MAAVHPDQPGSRERFLLRPGLLHPPPLPHAARRLHLHRHLQLEDDQDHGRHDDGALRRLRRRGRRVQQQVDQVPDLRNRSRKKGFRYCGPKERTGRADLKARL